MSMKEVTKKEFDEFIKNYPRELQTNFFMDDLSYYDFPDNFKPGNLEELYSCVVAQNYFGYDEHKYYIKEM